MTALTRRALTRTALLGAGWGAAFGLVTSMIVAILVIGTEGIPEFGDDEGLPFLYALAAISGVVVGSVAGLAAALLAVTVANQSSASPHGRRLRGTAAAAGVGGVLIALVMPAFLGPYAIVTALLVAAAAAALAWLSLPSLVALDSVHAAADAAPLEARSPDRHAPDRRAPAPMLNRVALTIALTVVAVFLGANVAASFAADRQTADVFALVGAGVLGILTGAVTWWVSGRGGRGENL